MRVKIVLSRQGGSYDYFVDMEQIPREGDAISGLEHASLARVTSVWWNLELNRKSDVVLFVS